MNKQRRFLYPSGSVGSLSLVWFQLFSIPSRCNGFNCGLVLSAPERVPVFNSLFLPSELGSLGTEGWHEWKVQTFYSPSGLGLSFHVPHPSLFIRFGGVFSSVGSHGGKHFSFLTWFPVFLPLSWPFFTPSSVQLYGWSGFRSELLSANGSMLTQVYVQPPRWYQKKQPNQQFLQTNYNVLINFLKIIFIPVVYFLRISDVSLLRENLERTERKIANCFKTHGSVAGILLDVLIELFNTLKRDF